MNHNHKIVKCSCGVVLAQCRCMGVNKAVEIRNLACEKCKLQRSCDHSWFNTRGGESATDWCTKCGVVRSDQVVEEVKPKPPTPYDLKGEVGNLATIKFLWITNALTGKVDMTPDEVMETVAALQVEEYKDGFASGFHKGVKYGILEALNTIEKANTCIEGDYGTEPVGRVEKAIWSIRKELTGVGGENGKN